MSVLAFIPARGGSKSIVYKNLVPIAGVEMMAYAVSAVRAATLIDHYVCSTEDDRIAAYAEGLGLPVDRRPAALAADETPILDVLKEYLLRVHADPKTRPEIVALIQVTSPFLRPTDIDAVLGAMRRDPAAMSGQTIAKPPHNFHAWNQREVDDAGYVRFRYKTERERAHNKQLKPELFVFGNMLATRTEALLDGRGVFAEPSVACRIEWPYYLDVDGPEDRDLAEILLAAGKVDLPHMS